MDSDTLKVLLDSQNQAFRSALDIVVEQFNSRIASMESKISDITRSLDFSHAETVDLKGEVKLLQQTKRENNTIIEGLKNRVEDVMQRMNNQEDYSRRNNIRISGFKESPNGETWEQTAEQVSTLIQDKLQLPSAKLEHARRVGPVTRLAPRTIVARFEHFGDREAVTRNSRKLKGTGIFINEDLCPASQENVKNQLPLMKQARTDGKIAYFKHTRLIIKERTGPQLPTDNGVAASGGGDEPPWTSNRSVVASGASASVADVVPSATHDVAGGASAGASAGGGVVAGDGEVTTEAPVERVTSQHRLCRKDLRDRKKK
ncbi:hypothetical protein Pcinc_006743 [Petrolisthes cinctipes]|uniref:Uncharacterized protein n=1 Tax=Petrolisthes cinctipes TaxID=88211 RepID=A0AAE1G9T9_PETCI|nr:hypothetical protein Pcinc_006743 [Petrolisthes cinctipes]